MTATLADLPGDWRFDASCNPLTADDFYPAKTKNRTPATKKTCARCHVLGECLEYALANDEQFGIWGGLSRQERRALAKDIAAEAAS